MTPEEKQEFKEYIHSTISGYHAKVDAQNTVTNIKLETINKHLEKQNGRIGNAEKAIAMALEERAGNRQLQQQYRDTVDDLVERVETCEKVELQHVLNCPISPKLRVIEDLMLSQASVKKFMFAMFMGGIAIGSFVVGALKLIL